MFVYMFGVTNRRFGAAPGGEASDITLSRRTASWRSLVRHSSMPPCYQRPGALTQETASSAGSCGEHGHHQRYRQGPSTSRSFASS